MRAGFRVVCAGQDKGLGPKWAKLLSAHLFFGPKPNWGGDEHFALCTVLLWFTGGTGNCRSPYYLGNYDMKEIRENPFDIKIGKIYAPNGTRRNDEFCFTS